MIKHTLTVILPVYNEEENIAEVIERVESFLRISEIFKDFEIIAVDDGSRDATPLVLGQLQQRIPCLRMVTHKKNLGYGKALLSGVRNSRNDLILSMDADGQFKIDSLGGMLNYISDFDLVIGYRREREDSFYRIVLGKIYNYLALLLFGLNVKDINCGFKLFKREIMEDSYLTNGGVFYTEVLLRAQRKGFRVKEVSVQHFPRIGGKETGGNLKVIVGSLKDIARLLDCLRRGSKRKYKKIYCSPLTK